MPPEDLALVRFLFIILVPLVPAFLLFKAIPEGAGAGVAGTLQGLKVKLGGAFAGYFALLLLILFQYPRLFPPPVLSQVWDLYGTVTDEKTGKPIYNLMADNIHLSQGAAAVDPHPDGTFHLIFYTMPNYGGQSEFPTITVQIDTFSSPTISLNGSQFSVDGHLIPIVTDEPNHHIRIAQIPVSEMLASPYNRAAPLLKAEVH